MFRSSKDAADLSKNNFRVKIARAIQSQINKGRTHLSIRIDRDSKIFDSCFADEILAELEQCGYSIEHEAYRVLISWNPSGS